MYIISVTGSKGKTTVTRLISQALTLLGEKTLRVDGQEVAINETIQEHWTQKQSKDTYGLSLSVCTGKLLCIAESANVAVLETSIGCWRQGTGYDIHQIGIFTNVFEEHLSPKRGIRTIDDVARAKSFILTKIAPDGLAVINLDDPHVRAQAVIARQSRPDLRFIGYTLQEDTNDDLCEKILCLSEGRVILKTGDTKTNIVNIADIPWTFNGLFQPSIYNLLALCGALIGYCGPVTDELIDAVKHSQLSEDGGRLTLIKSSSKNISVLLDYAHEPQSLGSIIKLCRKLSRNDRVIGVVRTSPRSDLAIANTAVVLAELLDEIVIYNKYDGVLHKARDQSRVNLCTKAAMQLQKSIELNGKRTRLYDREDEAFIAALESANPGDIIFHMVHDNAKSSVQLVRKLLNE